jgi:DNA-binding MarR family transcriptional regulator
MESLFDQAAAALFHLGRSFARLSVLPDEAGDDRNARSHIKVQLCLAIEVGQREGDAVTVGTIARTLTVDASTASRLVNQAARDGLIVTSPSSTDRRRLMLTLTPAGEELVTQARRYQRQVFDELTATWDPSDRETFALLFLSFSQDVIRKAAARGAGPG